MWKPILNVPYADTRAHPAEEVTQTASNMSNYSTFLLKAESIWSICEHIDADLNTQQTPDLCIYRYAAWPLALSFLNIILSSIGLISIFSITIWNHFLWLDKTGVPPGQPAVGGGFDASSFIGGMMLAFIIILAVTVGYRLFCSKQEIRYRVMWVSTGALR